MNQNLKAQMKRIPLIAGVFGLIMISIGLAGLFVEKLSNNDGALLISGAIILSSLLIDWRSPKN
jgi:phosphatidylglycerophosphate synthase